ncbi:40741_t:CDS:2, partial [Gigaspora margarita]
LSHHPPVISQIEISDCPQLKDIEMINDNQLTNINEVISKLPNLRLLDVEGNQLVELDISHNTKLSYLSCDTQVQPIQTLVKTIQETETKLTDLQRSQNRKSEQITQLEQQIQSLKDLQKRLETQSQQKETELTTELNQLKQNKNELETKLRDHDNDLTTTRQQLDQIKFELTQKDQELTIAKNSLQTSQDHTGLLTQQVENLTQQLTESQQQEERI